MSDTGHDVSIVLEHKRRQTVAIVLTMIAYLLYNISDAIVKMLAATFPGPQIMALGGLVLAACACTYGLVRGGKGTFRINSHRWVWLRAALALCCGFLNVLALPHVELTVFYTLIFTSPFWVAVLSIIFLKEKIERRRIAVIVFGFCVIAYIMRPGGDIFNIWSCLVLGSALTYACSVTVMRFLSNRESRVMIITTGAMLSSLVMLPSAIATWQPVTMADAGLFFTMGLCGAIGTGCIAYAFQTAPSASVIAPFHYTQMIWGAGLGYLLFAEVPQVQTMVGAALLIAAGLLLIWLEVRALRATPPPVMVSPLPVAGWFSRLRAYSPSLKRR